jgi:hypothetical protein
VPAGWVSAGVAVAGAAENISANKSAQSAQKANNANNAVLTGAQNSMLTQAEGISQQPFTPYTGTLTAPMSGNEQQGYNLASKTAASGQVQGLTDSATNLIGGVANNGWSADTAAKYMSPYTQDVTDKAVAAENKSYLQNLSGLQTNAAGSSAFGGSREAIQQGTLAADHNINAGTLTATGNANAYDSALKAWGQDNNTKLAAADAYLKAGSDITQMNSQQISDLMKTGGVAQVISQTDLNNQYGQFMRQQNWAPDRLNSLISAVGADKGSPAQTPAIQSNTANQLLGLGSTVAGLFGGGSGSGAAYDPNAGTSAGQIDTSGMANNVGGLNNFQANPVMSGTSDAITSGAMG